MQAFGLENNKSIAPHIVLHMKPKPNTVKTQKEKEFHVVL